ncbi:MAG: TolC family protein [Prolixibacteraceae bacterium]
MNSLEIIAEYCHLLILVLILTIGLPILASSQNSLENFIDSALVHSPNAVSINAQIKSYTFNDQMISAVLRSPKAFISSELLVAPYLNNKGKFIDTAPLDKAIGYDVGITNGGLYSFLFNLQFPLLKGKQVLHLQEQNKVEVEKLQTQLKLIENELKYNIGRLYFDALAKQVTMENNRKNNALLNEEFQLIKRLTSKGLYRISDYKLMELSLKSDSINLSTSSSDLELAIRQLKAACGIKNQEIEQLTIPQMVQSEPLNKPSLFIRSFSGDSLAAVAQQKAFDDQYQPQLNVYANSGLNSTSIPMMQRHIGASAGIQLSYTLFDGHQKKINQEQQMLRIDEAQSLRGLKIREVKTRVDAFKQNIEKTKAELSSQKEIQAEYKDLLTLYQDELQRAQISVIDLIAYLQKYSSINLELNLKEITLKRLINEYNYWNK